MRRLPLIIMLTVASVGLAASAAPAPASTTEVTVAVARGSEVARRSCAGCHAIALEQASRERDAPPFRVLGRLYSAENLQTKLTDIAANGHFEMPRVTLAEDEISDVSAYIASLQPLEDRGPPPVTKRSRHKTAWIGTPTFVSREIR